jgi:hypothetical protein
MPEQSVRLETLTAGESNVSFTWSLTAPHGPEGSFVVSVSVTLPAARSAALGVYVALSADAPGANAPPDPPLHVALVAAPPIAPASWIGVDTAQVIWSGPAFTVAAGLMTMTMRSVTCWHGPPVAALVSVSVTLPVAISAALGVYVALSVEAPGL